MVEELGEERARQIFSRATYRMGRDGASKYPAEAHGHPAAFAQAFVEQSPVNQELFRKATGELDEDRAEATMGRCVLVEQWREMGLADEQVQTLCDVAHAIDFGTADALGLDIEFAELIAAGDRCCRLSVRRRRGARD